MDTSSPGQPFLPHLAGLILELESSASSEDEKRKVGLQLEQLPYLLRGMETAFEQFMLTGNAVLAQHSVSPQAITIVRPFFRDRLNLFVDVFLDTARRTQNALIPYLRRKYQAELPKSMADLVKKLDRLGSQLPDSVQASIQRYWNSHGQRLKDYRDLAQHHGLVASDIRLTLSRGGRPLLYLALPNNPAVKSPIALSYSDPTVHACEYLETEFVAIIRFCHEVTRGMLTADTPRVATMGVRFKGPVTLGGGSRQIGAVVPTAAEINQRFTALLKELNDTLKKEHG